MLRVRMFVLIESYWSDSLSFPGLADDYDDGTRSMDEMSAFRYKAN